MLLFIWTFNEVLLCLADKGEFNLKKKTFFYLNALWTNLSTTFGRKHRHTNTQTDACISVLRR